MVLEWSKNLNGLRTLLLILMFSILLPGCRDAADNKTDSNSAEKNNSSAGSELEKTPDDNPKKENDTKEPNMQVQTEPYGKTSDGRGITKYFLSNTHGMTVEIINWGATVTAVNVPDRDGNIENVVLGYEDIEGYLNNVPYFGVTCGRYANRIAEGKFSLNGKEYTLAINNEPNHLHGGLKGFDKAVWDSAEITQDDAVGVELKYESPDKEEGYPGTVKLTVRYLLNDKNELTIQYSATTDQETPVNFTNHSYWNLADEGDILSHELMLACDQFIPVDETSIPTGELKSVASSPMDFLKSQVIGSRIDQVTGGYDHCYVIKNGTNGKLNLAAKVIEPKSGRVMEVLTTEPGVQFYTGNFLDGSEEVGGYKKNEGFCLECQHFPDSPNQPDFPNTILKPTEVYQQTTVHRFSVVK